MSDTFEVELERLDGYRFRTDFRTAGVPPLEVDEPPPLGGGAGPNPARLLAAAVGDCLSASLLFCLSKSRVDVAGLRTRVTGTYVRNERNRLRIGVMDVVLALDAPADDAERVRRCLGTFEDFCIVTATVRAGVDVRVTVTDAAGRPWTEERAAGA
jgi:uncharacterized OsmC-like protein